MKRWLIVGCLSAVALQLGGPVRVHALDIEVTTDSGGIGGPDCTLRDAVSAANQDAPSGGCPGGLGTDTIVLGAPVYTLFEVDNVTDGPNGLPSIASSVIIEGGGAAIERLQGAPHFRILHVSPLGSLTLHAVVVRSGSCPDGAAGSPGSPGVDGGGILNRGTLLVEMSTVTANRAGRGGAADSGSVGGVGGRGGGIYNAGTLDVQESTLSANSAGSGGIGALAFSSQGGAGGAGGGVYNTGSLRLIRSTVNDNRAGGGGADSSNGGNGGGIANVGGSLAVTNSTVSGNAAGPGNFDPFGRGFGRSGDGGGLFDEGGSAALANATVVANLVFPGSFLHPIPGRGGGLFTGPSSAVVIGNSIVARNTAGSTESDCFTTTDLESLGYNLFGTDVAACAIAGNTMGNKFVQDPGLGPLQSNGGPTATHALLAGSPAIDSGTPQVDGGCTDSGGNPLTTDQRGVPRPQGPRCDIGAFEASPSEPLGAPLLGANGLIGSMVMLLCLGWRGLRRHRLRDRAAPDH